MNSDSSDSSVGDARGDAQSSINGTNRTKPSHPKRRKRKAPTIEAELYEKQEVVQQPKKRRASKFTDAGGMLISIPVSHFNGDDNQGWKGFFENQRRSFIVAIVVFSDKVKKRHEASFLGSPKQYSVQCALETFSFSQNACTLGRTWMSHDAFL